MALKTPAFTVLERGWLSSNSIVFWGETSAAVVDTGYCTHAGQTLSLIQSALNGRDLDRIINTHLHSDHCGGNATLQSHYPNSRTWIPSASSAAVAAWDQHQLTYLPAGQQCPRFSFDHVLQNGESIELGGFDWQIHAAPGHDPESIILFEPSSRTLISADALWENGFGVVFPELEGEHAFDLVGQTLDLIERLAPLQIIPGHGKVFSDLPAALTRARSRLAQFQNDPRKHANYAAKVLIKYKLLEWQQSGLPQLQHWAQSTPYLNTLHQSHFNSHSFFAWLDLVLGDLVRAQAIQIQGDSVINCN
ncbi:MAG: MBL fold metallo-hydrolase [Brachymonas sp.]|nr:MBL fold metallo-hydrolase [Brachymonas sp.]